VHRRVLVPLLETLILGDVVKVILTDDARVLHLGRLDDARDHLATNGYIASPWALLVDIGALDGSARGLDAKTARLVVARLTDAGLLGAEHTLLRLEDVVLLLERPLVLLDGGGDSGGRHDTQEKESYSNQLNMKLNTFLHLYHKNHLDICNRLPYYLTSIFYQPDIQYMGIGLL